MENIKYGRRREGRWTPIRAKAQDTRANPNSSETHLVRKRWDIGLLRALNPRIMMMMMKLPQTCRAQPTDYHRIAESVRRFKVPRVMSSKMIHVGDESSKCISRFGGSY